MCESVITIQINLFSCNGEIRALLGGSSQQSEQSILTTFTKWKTAHCIIYICHLVESYSGQVWPRIKSVIRTNPCGSDKKKAVFFVCPVRTLVVGWGLPTTPWVLECQESTCEPSCTWRTLNQSRDLQPFDTFLNALFGIQGSRNWPAMAQPQ